MSPRGQVVERECSTNRISNERRAVQHRSGAVHADSWRCRLGRHESSGLHRSDRRALHDHPPVPGRSDPTGRALRALDCVQGGHRQHVHRTGYVTDPELHTRRTATPHPGTQQEPPQQLEPSALTDR